MYICVLCHSVMSDCSPPGSSVHGIFQASILEWVAISSFRGSSPPRDRTHVSYISCIGRRVLYRQCHLRSPDSLIYILTNICFHMEVQPRKAPPHSQNDGDPLVYRLISVTSHIEALLQDTITVQCAWGLGKPCPHFGLLSKGLFSMHKSLC